MLAYKFPLCLFLFIKKDVVRKRHWMCCAYATVEGRREQQRSCCAADCQVCSYRWWTVHDWTIIQLPKGFFFFFLWRWGTWPQITRLWLIEVQTHSMSMNPSRSYDPGQTVRGGTQMRSEGHIRTPPGWQERLNNSGRRRAKKSREGFKHSWWILEEWAISKNSDLEWKKMNLWSVIWTDLSVRRDLVCTLPPWAIVKRNLVAKE